MELEFGWKQEQRSHEDGRGKIQRFILDCKSCFAFLLSLSLFSLLIFAISFHLWLQIALARKDGTIDIVKPDESLPGPEQQQQQAGPSSSSTSTSPDPKEKHLQASNSIVNAELLVTIKENRMKAGIERWVGLAVAQE